MDPKQETQPMGEDCSMPRPPRRRTLAKPIAIPATSSTLGSPFLRAYPPELERVGITREMFLEFLDHLNRAAVASPPLLALSLVSGIIGFVPEPTVQIVSTSLDAAAEATTYALSRGRTEMLLRSANRDIFGPHRMRASVAKLDVVAHLAQMPILDDTGKILKESKILLPLEDEHALRTVPGQMRRLQALEPWLSPLELEELPELTEATNLMGKMHSTMSEFQRKESEKSILEKRTKAHDKLLAKKEKAEKRYGDEILDISRDETKIKAKKGEIPDKDKEKFEQKRQKALMKYEEKIEKKDKRYTAKDKEEKGIRKILFLLLTNIDEINVPGEPEEVESVELTASGEPSEPPPAYTEKA